MKSRSINSMAAVFDVDRASLYAWIRRGCPCEPAERRGRPARMDFRKVLVWRLTQLADQGFFTADGLALEETRIRARFKALTPTSATKA